MRKLGDRQRIVAIAQASYCGEIMDVSFASGPDASSRRRIWICSSLKCPFAPTRADSTPKAVHRALSAQAESLSVFFSRRIYRAGLQHLSRTPQSRTNKTAASVFIDDAAFHTLSAPQIIHPLARSARLCQQESSAACLQNQRLFVLMAWFTIS